MVEILSCNVQGSGPNQTIILEMGAKRNVEVILIQELRVTTHKQTPTHHEYTLYEPSHIWDKDLKTLTYVRKDISASVTPYDMHLGHMTSVFLTQQNVHIHNIYRPGGSGDESWIHQRIMSLKGNRMVIAGDFNKIGFGGTDTDPRLSTSENLLDFLNQHQQILNDPDIPTRGQAVLDLACSNIPGARA